MDLCGFVVSIWFHVLSIWCHVVHVWPHVVLSGLYVVSTWFCVVSKWFHVLSMWFHVVLVLVWRKIPLLRLIYITLAAFVLLTPTLHPWYVVWLVPLLVFYRNPAWVAFTLLVVLSYQVLIRYEIHGVWEELPWVRWVEFGGFVGVWVLSSICQSREIIRPFLAGKKKQES